MAIETLASRINTAIILVLVLCWCVELFVPHGWHQKVSLLYEIDVGLMGVEINRGVAVKAIDLAIRGLTPGAADALTEIVVGKYSVVDATEYLCSVSQSFAPGVNGCEIWSRINSASRIMLCLIITGIILLSLGGAFHYHYWFISPRRKTRMWTRGFLISAPAVITSAFLIYYAMTKNLAHFPPRGTMTFGYCYIFGLYLCIWTCVPIFIHEQFAVQSSSEVMIEEKKKAQKHFQNYGAAQQHAGFAPQQHYVPQMGLQPQLQYVSELQYAPQPQFGQQPQYAPQYAPEYAPQAGGVNPAPQPWATEMGAGYSGQRASGGAVPFDGAIRQGALRTSSTGQAEVLTSSSGALRTSSTRQAQVPVSSSGAFTGSGAGADTHVDTGFSGQRASGGAVPFDGATRQGALRTSSTGQAEVLTSSSGALRTSSTSQAQVPVSSSGAITASLTGQAEVLTSSSGALRTSSTSQAQVPVSSSGAVTGGGAGADTHGPSLAAQHNSGSPTSGAVSTSAGAPPIAGADEEESSSSSSNEGSDSTGSSEAGNDSAAAPVEAVDGIEVTATPAAHVVPGAATTIDGQQQQQQ